MSPEQTELRKSLESIQSMLSNPSPMMAKSLASRIHRASLDGGLEDHAGGGGGASSSDADRRHHRSLGHDGAESGGGGRSLGSNSNGGEQQRSSSGSGQGGGGSVSFQLTSAMSSSSAGGSFPTTTISSPLAPIAEPRGSNSSSSGHDSVRDSLDGHGAAPILSPRLSGGGRDSLSYTPFQQIEHAPPHDDVVGATASAFRSVESAQGGRQRQEQQGQRLSFRRSRSDSGAGVIRSPSSAFSAVTSASAFAALGNARSPDAMGGGATPSGHGVMSGALGSVSSSGRTGGSMAASTAAGGGLDTKSHQERRETSLLVSPVASQHSSDRSSRRSDAESVFGSHATDSPSVAAGATPSAASARSANSRNNVQQQQHGPTGTPMVGFSASASKKNSVTPSTAGLTIHTNLQPSHGRDPTPYHHRTDPSTSPYSSNKENDYVNGGKVSDASSRIGRDPPAKSPFPTHINASGTGGDTVRHHAVRSGPSGFAANKNTPAVHPYNYHSKDHHHSQPDENELSMIEEDDSIADESLVSHVTGGTFVRTPIGRKHGHNHTPKSNATAGHATSHATAGNHHGHRGPHLTPRGNARGGQAYATATTPGSTASTAIHATPSTTDLLHRPSLAMRENLAHLATTTSHALEEIWDCVGVPPDERASMLADLVEKISQLCEEKVRGEDGVRATFQEEIDKARKEWEETCAALRLDGEEDPVNRMRRDPSAKDLGGGNGGVCLQMEYEVMMGRLESLRSVKQAAMADMQASRSKIHQAFAALHGCTVEEASQATEMQPYADFERNLTLEHREEFRSKARDYEESVATRKKAIVSLLLDCQSILQELDIVPQSGEDSVGRSEEDVKIWNSLEPIGDDQAESAGQRRGQSNHYTIVSLFESPTCIGIGNSALDRLTSRIAELNGEKKRRRAKLGEMGSAIAALWSMLRVPSDEQRAFTSGIRGLGLDTLRKGEAEIARLEDLKGVMLGKLVREQRSIIEDLWEKTNSSVAERASFDAYFLIHDDEQLTSQVLVKHEEYVATLKSKLNKMQPILDLIAKRESIIDERVELEFLRKDPGRLKGRYASKQLAKEEKMNRRVTKELPKITSMLERTLKQWYAENKPHEEEGQVVNPELGHFMYQGKPYLQIIQCQEEDWRTRKERDEQERQCKRQEERAASSSASAAFGYTTYKTLPGKKWNPSVNNNTDTGATSAGARPRSASNMRSKSNIRSGSAMRSGGSHPSTSGNPSSRSGSNMRFGGRGPLGDVSSSRQNAPRPPSRPQGGPAGGVGASGVDRGKKAPTGAGRGYRPASAPRMRL